MIKKQYEVKCTYCPNTVLREIDWKTAVCYDCKVKNKKAYLARKSNPHNGDSQLQKRGE